MAEQPIPEGHHQPVLADRVTELLVTDTRGSYLDLTVGGGGHLLALARSLEVAARLYGVDTDSAAIARAQSALAAVGQEWKLVQTSFGKITDACERLGERTFDGILLDLGISSYQLDDASRGISFRLDGPLDMRLDPSRGTPAHELVNNLREPELRRIIDTYGEERRAARIAAAIVRERQRSMILTTAQLREIVLTVARPPHETKSLARVFQALRIAVNRELEELEAVLPQARDLLRPGGRLAVIAYHSLEDRIVKRFFQIEAKGRCTCPSGLPVCVCGAVATLSPVNRKSIVPDQQEIETNPRARSARLRVAEKMV